MTKNEIESLEQLAAELSLDCDIERSSDGDALITMATGEEEPAAQYEDGVRIIRAYAAL